MRSCGNRSGNSKLRTRGQITKSAALAEVLDHFRVPVFAVGRGDGVTSGAAAPEIGRRIVT